MTGLYRHILAKHLTSAAEIRPYARIGTFRPYKNRGYARLTAPNLNYTTANAASRYLRDFINEWTVRVYSAMQFW